MPTVTFVVPCYRLAHFLPDCINSILEQTYSDFEILIMDDCSPDDTAAVATGFSDPRVKHIRNATNLRNIRNYNKGIGLAQGKYVWLISADDRLRCNYVLQRFVNLLEQQPSVGFVFCPAMTLTDHQETGVVQWVERSPHDFTAPGLEYLRTLLRGNRIAAPTVLARKSLYEHEMFPLDMPHAGDWYLWCRFLMHADVAYLSEPMVHYRLHASNMTWTYAGGDGRLAILDDLRVLCRLRTAAETHAPALVDDCDDALVTRCTDLIWPQFTGAPATISMDELATFLREQLPEPRTHRRIHGRICRSVADHLYWRGESKHARQFFWRALQFRPDIKAIAKLSILHLGAFGQIVRRSQSRAA